MASVRERNGCYNVVWRDAEGRQRSQVCKTRRAAANLKSKVEGLGKVLPHDSLRPREPYRKPRDGRTGLVTVAGYVPVYMSQHRLSEEARRVYGLAVRKYLIPQFTGAMADVTAKDVRTWFRELEAEGRSGAVLAKLRTIGSSIWSDALEDDGTGVTMNPWRGQRIKPHRAKRSLAERIMTPGQVRNLINSADPGCRLVVKTLANTGMRFSEAVRLQPEDVTGTTIHIRQSKNGRARDIEIPPELADELRAALPFRTSDGNQVNYFHFRKYQWKPAISLIGSFTPHDLRHTHASHLVQAGVDLVTVRDRLGHSSIVITSRYLHALPQSQQKALGKLNAFLQGWEDDHLGAAAG